MVPRNDVVSNSGGRNSEGRSTGEGNAVSAIGDGIRNVRTLGNAVSLPAIEKLRGRENYGSWAFAMKMTLIREGTWRAVKPVANQEVDPDVSERALATICLTLEKNNYSLVKNCTTANEAWEKLQKAFQDDGLIRRFGLLDRLTSVKLELCESVEDYVDELVTTAQSLSEIGFEVNDQWLASLLLKGLPEYYNPMIMGLQASGLDLTADLVKAKILQDVKWPIKNAGLEGALFTKHKAKDSTKRINDKKNGACFNCKKIGHFAANCPSKHQSIKPKSKALCAMVVTEREQEDHWYFDSAASSHMTRNVEVFHNRKNVDLFINTANNQAIRSSAKGNINLELKEGPVEVQDVLYVPELATNLLSISTICKKNLTVTFTASKCEVHDELGEIVASGVEIDGLYRVNVKDTKCFMALDANIWHKRLGHLNQQSMRKLTSMVEGFTLKQEDMPDCQACVKGKHARDSFSSSTSKAKGVLDLVHSDVCGPIEVPSLGGSRYFVTFIDDASRKVFVYFLASKGQVPQVYEKFKTMAERQTGLKIKILRTDNGTEYVNTAMKKSMERDGIVHQTTCPYSPEQNGTAERMNRTLIEKARCMLYDARLPKKFWAEAVSTAAYIVNRCSTKAIESVTPYEAWSKNKPSLKHMKVFGSKAMYHIPKQKRQKFDAKSVEGIFVGYAQYSKGYRIYDPQKDEVVICRDVVILDEGKFPISAIREKTHSLKQMELFTWLDAEDTNNVYVNQDDVAVPVRSTQLPETEELSTAEPDQALPPQQKEQSADMQHGLRRSGRERIFPGKYSDFVCVSSITGSNVSTQLNSPITTQFNDEPKSYMEALKRPDAIHWEEAMRSEIQALQENNTWELTDLPPGRKAIRNKWIFKTKRGIDGEIERYKARLVVKGCSQRPGIDYEEVYSPVVRYATVRYLIALSVQHDLDIEQMDAVTAFLQGKLTNEEIFMELPEGIDGDSQKVCRLKRGLYGLKQSSRIWNTRLNDALIELGLRRSKLDPCLYFNIEKSKMLFLTVYVDDFLIFTNDEVMKESLKNFLNSRFKMKDIGEAKYCLGLKITRDRKGGKIAIDQQNYIEELLNKYGMANSKPVATPLDANIKLNKSMCPSNVEELNCMKNIPYKEAVGSLQYAAQTTRPDIAFAVNLVSQFSVNPGKRHWEAVKRIMRYLRGTVGSRLQYTKDSNPQLTGFTDADWGGDEDSRRSTTGFVFRKLGGAIVWSVKRQPTVALSSCEAEFMALSLTTQEALWWQQLMEEIDGKQKIPIFCDNQSAICIAQNDSFNSRTKHISTRYYFVKDVIERGDIALDYISTHEHPADGFTKALAKQKHNSFKDMLGIIS